MGGTRPKQLLPLAGRPVIEHSIAAFCAAPEIDGVIVLMVDGFLTEVEKVVAEGGYDKVTRIAPGGESRSETSWRAIREAEENAADEDRLLLHDAVRPLVSPRLISACAAELRHTRAVGVAVPTSDTIVEVAASTDAAAETVTGVPPRTSLRRMQTPQGFRLRTVREAYERARADPAFTATDDCGVVMRYLPREEVRVVAGEERNIKITHPGDVAIASALLEGAR